MSRNASEKPPKRKPSKRMHPKFPVWIATMGLLCFNVTISECAVIGENYNRQDKIGNAKNKYCQMYAQNGTI
jgi:hypothetical protein